MNKDDLYVPVDTETVKQPVSFKKLAMSFVAKFLVSLVVAGLAALLAIQIVPIFSNVQLKANDEKIVLAASESTCARTDVDLIKEGEGMKPYVYKKYGNPAICYDQNLSYGARKSEIEAFGKDYYKVLKGTEALSEAECDQLMQ